MIRQSYWQNLTNKNIPQNILFELRYACDILFLTFDFNFKEREVVIEIMIKEANNYGE